TLRPGLTALRDAPVLNDRWLEGVADTFGLVTDVAGVNPRPAALGRFAAVLQRAGSAPSVTLADAWTQAELLAACATETAMDLDSDPTMAAEVQIWARALA